MKKTFITTLFIALLTVSISCKKFVDVGTPKTEVLLSDAFKEDNSATSAVLGIYINMLSDFNFINGGITIYSGLSADELEDFSQGAEGVQFQQNQLIPTNSVVSSMWTNAYQNLVLINTCIEGLNKSTTLSAAVKQQLLGECKFSRAFINFYLVNLWGNMPLVTTPDYTKNAVIAQSSAEEVYSAIFQDLKDAKSELSATYPTSGKVRPNKWTATALLARAYLYHKDYASAVTESSAVIGSGLYGPLPDLNSVFLSGSTEAIWQLMPSKNLVLTTQEASDFMANIPYGGGPGYTITSSLLNSFEANDNRQSAWIDTVTYNNQLYYYPFKYKDVGSYSQTSASEYYIMFRLSEQYMIRAEANTQLGNTSAALTDVNVIRNRAGLASLQVTGKDNLLTAIEKENRHEFFAEWGHRWMDLKRTSRVDAVLSAEKSTWKSTAALFPIPQSDINLNNKLKQNSGY
jgi:hypothetical protein